MPAVTQTKDNFRYRIMKYTIVKYSMSWQSKKLFFVSRVQVKTRPQRSSIQHLCNMTNSIVGKVYSTTFTFVLLTHILLQ